MQLHYRRDTPPALVRCPAADVRKLQKAPINARAWTLQELILSRRTVHFAADQLFWQCRTLLLSEDGLVQADKFESLRGWADVYALDFSDASIARQYWWKWVEDYTERELTNSGDWLAAFAGITQYFAEESGLTPCLGLWEEALVQDLGWRVARHMADEGTAPARRTVVPGVPSWSWLRIQARVERPDAVYIGEAYSRDLAVAGPPAGASGGGHDEPHGVRWAGAPLASRLEAAQLVLTGPVTRMAFRRRMHRRDGRMVWALERAREPDYALFWPDDPVPPGSAEGTFEAACLGLSMKRFGHVLDTDWSVRRGCFLVLRRVWRHCDEEYQYPMFERLGVGDWEEKAENDPFEGVEPMAIVLC
jgi:hypothetical protein